MNVGLEELEVNLQLRVENEKLGCFFSGEMNDDFMLLSTCLVSLP